MNKAVITIGRGDTCDIRLEDECISASRLHAKIHFCENQYQLEDCSANGTMVNGKFVHNQIVPVQYGDIIQIASQYAVEWGRITQCVSEKCDVDFFESSGDDANAGMQIAEVGPSPYSWSWGAFALYPIWGHFNGCKWAVFVFLLLGWTIIPSFVFGICGKAYSWEKVRWNSYQDFVDEQAEWDRYGLYALLVDIIIIMVLLLLVFMH